MEKSREVVINKRQINENRDKKPTNINKETCKSVYTDDRKQGHRQMVIDNHRSADKKKNIEKAHKLDISKSRNHGNH